MIKKILNIGILLLVIFFGTNVFAIDYYYGETANILNPNINDAINTDVNPGVAISDPLREGAYKLVNAEDGSPEHQLQGLISSDTQIVEHSGARSETLGLVKRGVDYALGLLALIALIYLIYHGFLVLTAAGDEAQYKKGFEGLKTAGIAIAGVGLSWLFVSFLFWIIGIIT